MPAGLLAPVHTPLLQASFWVQSCASLHATPLVAFGLHTLAAPLTHAGTVLWQAPTPQVIVGQAFVDAAVAVVVDAVADLGRGVAGGAALHLAADAVLDHRLAGADAADRGAEALVRLPVAVVVLAVAGLGAGGDLAVARAEVAEHAGLGAAVADAHVLGRGRAGVTALGAAVHAVAAVVDHAVAVVVERAVADLAAGRAGGAALHLAADAVLDGDLAGADAAGGGAEALVDGAVAVVVDAVARLGDGAGAAAVDAGLVAVLDAVGAGRGLAVAVDAHAAHAVVVWSRSWRWCCTARRCRRSRRPSRCRS